MEYRVEEIARAAGVGVDTVRFYQTRGLLPAPERRGRVAIYDDDHLERLRRIRELNRAGLTLEGVRRVIESDRSPLLDALAAAEGERSYSLTELAAQAGVSELFLEVMQSSRLLEPATLDGVARYSESDLRTARAARELLDGGLPLEELVPLAQQHAEHVRALADRAIELFDSHVRRRGDPDGELSREEVSAAFQRLLPAATALVALHFQKTLIERVRERVAQRADATLEAALEASESARLNVSWG